MNECNAGCHRGCVSVAVVCPFYINEMHVLSIILNRKRSDLPPVVLVSSSLQQFIALIDLLSLHVLWFNNPPDFCHQTLIQMNSLSHLTQPSTATAFVACSSTSTPTSAVYLITLEKKDPCLSYYRPIGLIPWMIILAIPIDSLRLVLVSEASSNYCRMKKRLM